MDLEDPPPFGADEYMDKLPRLRRGLSATTIGLMQLARGVDALSMRVVDCVAFGLHLHDLHGLDFAVLIEDVQDVDFERYEFLELPPVVDRANADPKRQDRYVVKMIFCADEPGMRIEVLKMRRSAEKGRVYMSIDGPGTMAIS